MPARIVVVYNDPIFRDPLVTSLQASGHDVASFVDTSAAWNALEAAQRIEILDILIFFHDDPMSHQAFCQLPTSARTPSKPPANKIQDI